MKSYLDTLSTEEREALFDFMRQIGDEAEKLLDEHQKLSPRHGQIAVGAAHFDPWIRYYAIISYLTALRKGQDPESSAEHVRITSREAVKTHNSRRPRDINWQRDLDTASTHIDNLLRRTPRAK